ncbi:UDP-glucose 4-epimerase GalE [Agrilutibacter solisilvae]|uniref:UDP-glucose 4-epimerase n=1 Tax=Agrilutibacter solisilvae TaxID=2763317 RepID=A0A975ASG5_9GAMM|nr:UDP-glucose 4-epimerase GalE [Lysobacter solisilvae]QSX78919.1 UDP-glucose 4-epimerase GalE [Lysobacter solisilvae]
MAVVLVTGGAGFIGSHTCLALIQAGHRPVVLDDLSHGREAVLGRIGRITGEVPAFVRADVRDEAAVLAAMRAHAVAAVIHFAGRKIVGESALDPLGYYSNNVAGTIAVARAMQQADVTRLVFSSSCAVYGGRQASPVDESAALAPASPYGRSKAMCETLLRDACTADAALSVHALRYFNPVGAHASGLLGEDPFGRPGNLMPCITQVAAGRRAQLAIFGGDYPTRDGTGVRDYVHVMDLAEAHVAALVGGDAAAGFEAYNLGTGQGTSVLELVHAFEHACGRPIARQLMPRRAGDIAEMYADATAAQARLGWRARRGLEEMCADAWRWERDNPRGYEG